MLLAFVLLGSATAPATAIVHEALQAWGLEAETAEGSYENMCFASDQTKVEITCFP